MPKLNKTIETTKHLGQLAAGQVDAHRIQAEYLAKLTKHRGQLAVGQAGAHRIQAEYLAKLTKHLGQLKSTISEYVNQIDAKLVRELLLASGAVDLTGPIQPKPARGFLDALITHSKRIAKVIAKDPRFIMTQIMLHSMNIRYGQLYNPASAPAAILPGAGGNLPTSLDVLAGHTSKLIKQIDSLGNAELAKRSQINIAQAFGGFSSRSGGQDENMVLREFGPNKDLSVGQRLGRNRYTKKYQHGDGVKRSRRDGFLNVTFEEVSTRTAGEISGIKINVPEYDPDTGNYIKIKTGEMWQAENTGVYLKSLLDATLKETASTTTDRSKVKILMDYWNWAEVGADGKLESASNYALNESNRLGMANLHVPSTDGKYSFKSYQRDEIKALKAELDREIRNGIRVTANGEIILDQYEGVSRERDPLRESGYFPFYFESIVRETLNTNTDELPEAIYLQATLKDHSESFDPSWTPEEYFGRTEAIHMYRNTRRSIGFSFDIYANTPEELDLVRFKTNWLAQQTYGKFFADNQLAYSPLLRLTMGELYQRLGGYIGSLAIDWNYQWEIMPGKRIPLMVSITITYPVIHDRNVDQDSEFYPRLKGIQTG